MAIDSKALTDWLNSSKKPTYEVKFPAFDAEEILRAQLAEEALHKLAQDYVNRATKERLIGTSTPVGYYRKEDFFTTGEVPEYAKIFTSKTKSEPESLTATPVTKPPQGFDWT